jgi:small subunit ribosomal protein S9
VVQTPQKTPEQQYYYGIGRRKTAIARVRIYRDDARGGRFSINGKSLELVLPWPLWQDDVKLPFNVVGAANNFFVDAKVSGGGPAAQAEALRHGISRALVVYDATLKKALKDKGLLTRDARTRESKKYGLKRARRAPQYTKR